MKEVGVASGEEESTTVGAEVTSLSNTPVVTPTDDKELESIPEAEEALEVGAEMGEQYTTTKHTLQRSLSSVLLL